MTPRGPERICTCGYCCDVDIPDEGLTIDHYPDCPEIRKLVDAAVMAETERCAKFAEGLSVDYKADADAAEKDGNIPQMDTCDLLSRELRNVAAAIRSKDSNG